MKNRRIVLSLEQSLGFCIPAGLSRQTSLVTSPALRELLDHINYLKFRYGDSTKTGVRESRWLRENIVVLLDKFGQDIWPDQPARSSADWLTSAGINSFDGLYPRDLYWSRPVDRDKLVVEKCIRFIENKRVRESRRYLTDDFCTPDGGQVVEEADTIALAFPAGGFPASDLADSGSEYQPSDQEDDSPVEAEKEQGSIPEQHNMIAPVAQMHPPVPAYQGQVSDPRSGLSTSTGTPNIMRASSHQRPASSRGELRQDRHSPPPRSGAQTATPTSNKRSRPEDNDRIDELSNKRNKTREQNPRNITEAPGRHEGSRASSAVVDKDAEQIRTRQAGTVTAMVTPPESTRNITIAPPSASFSRDSAPVLHSLSSQRPRDVITSILTRSSITINFELKGLNPWVADMPTYLSSVGDFFEFLQACIPRRFRGKGLQIDSVNVDAEHPMERLSKICVSFNRETGRAAWKLIVDNLVKLGEEDKVVEPKLIVTVFWTEEGPSQEPAF